MRGTERKRRFGSTAIAGLCVLAILALLTALTAYLALTAPGHRTATWAVARLTDGRVRIAHLSGNLFSHIAADRIEIADDKGLWLTIDRPDMRWRALALLDRHADIRALTAARVTVLRRPVSQSDDTSDDFTLDIAHTDIKQAHFAKAALGHAGTLRLEGSLHYRSLQDAAADISAQRLDGNGRYRAQIRIRNGIPQGSAEITENGDGFIGALAGLPDIGPVRMRLNAAKDGTIALTLTAGALTADLHGTADIKKKRIAGRFALDAPAMAPRRDLRWSELHASGAVSGPLSRPDIRMKIQAKNLTASAVRIAGVSAAAEGRDGKIALTGTVDGLKLPGDRGIFADAPIRLDGHLDVADGRTPLRIAIAHPLLSARGDFHDTDGWRGTLRLDLPKLGPLAGLAGLALDGRAHFDGTLSRGNGSTRMTLNGALTAAGRSALARLLGRTEIELALARKDAGARASLRWHGAATGGSLLGRTDGNRLTGTGEMTLTDLSALSAKLAGQMRLHARLSGDAAPRLTADGGGSVAVAGGKAERIAFTLDISDPQSRPAGTLRLRGRFAGAPVTLAARIDGSGKIALQRLNWKSLSGHGVYIPGKRPQAQADLVFASLADLAPLAPGISGRAEAHLRLPSGQNRAGVEIRLNDFAAGETKIGTAEISGHLVSPFAAPELALTARATDISAEGIGGTAELRLSGPLAKPQAGLTAKLTSPAGPLTLDGRAQYDSTPGRLTVSALQAQWNGKQIALAAPATIRTGADGTVVDAKLSGSGGLTLALSGRLPRDEDHSYDLHFTGKARLGAWTDILSSDGRNLRGTASADLRIRGTRVLPGVYGSVRLDDGQYHDFATGISLKKISAALTASGSDIRLDRFEAAAHGGTIRGTGTIGTAGIMPVDFRFHADKARPFARDGMNATLRGEIRLQGALKGDMRVSGDLDIARGEIRIPDKMPASIAVLEVRRRGAPAETPAETPGRISLALTLTSPGEFFIRGRGLEAELEGKLHIAGTTTAPRIGGRLTMRRGSYALAGAPLEFQSGNIAFAGDSLDPALDFTAQTTANSITATLKITGTASHPKIALTSSPTLPQDEILAQLLFQQSVQDLSAVQLAQIAQSLATLSGLDSGIDPVGMVRNSLGLDKLTVGSGSDNSTTLEAGKYVLRRVYVGAKQDLSGGTRAEVQVDLGRRLKLSASVNASGETAVPTTSGDKGDTVGLSYQFEY